MRPGTIAKHIGKDPEVSGATVLVVKTNMPDYLPRKELFVRAVAVGNEYWGQAEIMKKEELEEIGNIFEMIDSAIRDKDTYIKNFDDGDWETEECQSCIHFKSDEHLYETGESFMVSCEWPEYDELIEYNRKTPCLGFRKDVTNSPTLDEKYANSICGPLDGH